MKLQTFILLGTILLGVGSAHAQTDGNAKNLYFGYKPKPRTERRQTSTATTPVRQTNTTVISTARTNTNRQNPARPRNASSNRNSPANTATASNVSNSGGVSPSTTGLPGTKVTIELMRGEKHSFVKPDYKFRSGDQIRIRMKTNFEGYISVLNLGSSGNVNLLYPVQGHDNYVIPTQDYQIPQGDGWIIFDNQPGTEIISVIMSEDELEGLNSLDNNSDYFRKDRIGKDLFVQTSGTDFYAVFRQQNSGENFGFTLKLKHKK
jgi:hypothetical protein